MFVIYVLCVYIIRIMIFLFVIWWWLFLFFFFKQKTAYEMRISDWSSDVCSSDLLHLDGDGAARVGGHVAIELQELRRQDGGDVQVEADVLDLDRKSVV